MAIFLHQEKYLGPFHSDSADFFPWPFSIFIVYIFILQMGLTPNFDIRLSDLKRARSIFLSLTQEKN